jgi:NADH:ubiquinone reductase (H+-translocating)
VQFAEIGPLRYDYLVLALGAMVNFFGVPGADQHAFPMYTLGDALRLKDHVLRRWEAADRDPALVDDGALNIVIVGGGPTGIESAGALAELYRSNFAEDYPGISQDEARLVLVEAGSELMPMFLPDIRSYTKGALEERGVEVLLGEVVASVEPTRVTLQSGKVIEAHTLIWGAGLQGSPIAGLLGLDLRHGTRVPTEPDLSLADHPEVFVVGDMAWITDTKTAEVLPQLGSVALQAGERAGENIARLVAGKDSEPFAYHDKGTMATIGRGSAVVQTHGGHTITGKPAFLAWGAVHLALLSTGEDRAKAVVDWTWAGFTHERAGRISVRTDED